MWYTISKGIKMPDLEIIVLINTLCEKGERYETNH